MTSFAGFIFVYVFGGLTFIPITIAIVFYLTSSPKKDVENEENNKLVVDVDPSFKAGDLNELKGVATKKQGYLHITRQFYPHQTDLDNQTENTDDAESNTTPTSAEQQRTRDKLKKKDKFYAVLKHGNLFLYKDSSPEAGPQQVIVLSDAFISIWPRTVSPQDDTPIPDGSLFTKKTCISIWKKHTAYMDQSNRLQFRRGGPSDQFFIYLDLNTDKEDWYFALIQATKMKKGPRSPVNTSHFEVEKALSAGYAAQTAHFKTKNMLYLIQTLNSTEGQHSSQWFNALIGRLFLSLQQTETLSNAVRERIYKKLKKINKPGLLDDFSIEKVTVGNSAPVISNPKLLDLTPEGQTRVSFDFLYTGHLHLIIATKMNINLGSRFKKREMDIKLSITVKKVEGPIVILIKPPPTNRLWYAFQTEPLLDIDVEPVVSTRQLSNNMVTNMIKSKFKEAIKESIVLPYMDDMVFYKTPSELYRGGIWESTKQKNDTSDTKDFEYIKSERQFNTGSSFRENNDISNTNLAECQSTNSPVDSPTVEESESTINESYNTDQSQKSSDSTRSFLKNKSNDDSNVSIRSRSSVDSTNSNATKRYLQTGMKKIGRWYKEQVVTVKESLNSDEELHHPDEPEGTEDQVGVISTKVTEKSEVLEKEASIPDAASSLKVETSFKTTEKPTTPEMITNRRVPRSKNSSIDNSKQEISHHTSESHRAEMFVNRTRARSTSGSYYPTSPDVYRRHEVSYSFTNNENLNPHSITSSDILEEAENTVPEVNAQVRKKRPPPPLPPR
ncbi:Nvj2 [Kluyveromyces lactis]|nr:Nvj2 [Kluyveromyces lactis]